MTFIPTYKKRGYYICCSTAKRYKKELDLCQMKLIKEIEIEEKVINIIRNITKEYVNKEKIINSVGAGFYPCPNYKKHLKLFKLKSQTSKE